MELDGCVSGWTSAVCRNKWKLHNNRFGGVFPTTRSPAAHLRVFSHFFIVFFRIHFSHYPTQCRATKIHLPANSSGVRSGRCAIKQDLFHDSSQWISVAGRHFGILNRILIMGDAFRWDASSFIAFLSNFLNRFICIDRFSLVDDPHQIRSAESSWTTGLECLLVISRYVVVRLAAQQLVQPTNWICSNTSRVSCCLRSNADT